MTGEGPPEGILWLCVCTGNWVLKTVNYNTNYHSLVKIYILNFIFLKFHNRTVQHCVSYITFRILKRLPIFVWPNYLIKWDVCSVY